MAKKSTGTPVTVALDRAGVQYTTVSYDHDPAPTSYGREAAGVLGVDPARLFKTLLVDTGSGLVVGVVPVLTQLDLKAMADALGAKKVAMADPAAAQRSTGMVVGGISPIGQKRLLPTVLDESMLAFDMVSVSGGRRGFGVFLAPQDLATLTNARFASIGRAVSRGGAG